MAETFLVKCLKPSTNLETFDDLKLSEFENNSLKMYLEKASCTSANAKKTKKKHIQRSYYQVQLWVQAPFRDFTLIMNPEMYGFERRGGILVYLPAG